LIGELPLALGELIGQGGQPLISVTAKTWWSFMPALGLFGSLTLAGSLRPSARATERLETAA
jgi:hypothetical protein